MTLTKEELQAISEREQWIKSATRVMVNLSDKQCAEIHFHILMDQIDKLVAVIKEQEEELERKTKALQEISNADSDNFCTDCEAFFTGKELARAALHPTPPHEDDL